MSLSSKTYTFSLGRGTTFYSNLGPGGLEAAWSRDPVLTEPMCMGATLSDGMLRAPHGK